MTKHLPALLKCPLFKEFDETELTSLLTCLNVTIKHHPANDYLLLHGNVVDSVGIIVAGTIEIIKENVAGDRHIVATLGTSDIFGEGIVCTQKRIAPVSARTKTEATILFIPYDKIIRLCNNACGYHTRLIQNMMLLLGEKNTYLNHKIDLLVLKGIKEKLAAFLINASRSHNSKQFSIPLNRNELAEYLNVSRPSMSRELATLKMKGIIDYHKNTFRIIDIDALTEFLL